MTRPLTPYDHARAAEAFHAWYRRAGRDRDHPPGSAQYYAQKAAWIACARVLGSEANRTRDVIKARVEEVGNV
jgi:hypothetical protein